MTASELIADARDFSPSFSPLRIGPAMALRMLSRAERSLFRSVTELKQDALASEETITISAIQAAIDASPVTGVTISAHFAVVGCRAIDTDGKDVKVDITPFSKRLNPGIFPSAWLASASFHPIDLRQFDYDTSGWEQYTSVRLSRVPVPPTLVALDDVLLAPDSARDALVAALSLSFSQRVNEPSAMLVQMATASMASAVSMLAHGDHSGSWHVMDSK